MYVQLRSTETETTYRTNVRTTETEPRTFTRKATTSAGTPFIASGTENSIATTFARRSAVEAPFVEFRRHVVHVLAIEVAIDAFRAAI